jgi:hypothetical protein
MTKRQARSVSDGIKSRFLENEIESLKVPLIKGELYGQKNISG